MKTILLIFFLNFLLLFTSCNGQTNDQPKIDFIITNDYMSERNLTLMDGPVPSNYNKEIIDSLRNSFVEVYDANNNIVQQKFYNSIGVLYYTNQKFYDNKNRLEKSVEIDEFKVDTCTTSFKYTNSLNLLIHKRVETSCTEDFLDFYYKYNDKGVKTEELLKENNILIWKKAIQNISKNEKLIKSYDNENRLSTYLYKYNAKDLLVYEKRKEWDYVIKGDFFETGQENEILYKYDKNGNWIERTTQTYCMSIKKADKKEPERVKEIGVYNIENCEAKIKEKLIRKIYYK